MWDVLWLVKWITRRWIQVCFQPIYNPLGLAVLKALTNWLECWLYIFTVQRTSLRQNTADFARKSLRNPDLSVKIPSPFNFKDTKIQGSLFASDIKMYIRICFGNVPFTRKQYIKNTSLVINNSNLNCEHVIKSTQTLIHPSAPTHSWHTDKQTQFCTDRHPHPVHPTYNPSTPAGK